MLFLNPVSSCKTKQNADEDAPFFGEAMYCKGMFYGLTLQQNYVSQQKEVKRFAISRKFILPSV